MPTQGVQDIQGIDVSHFQGTVDWQQVAQAGITFVFAKATEGITYVDPQFHANWAGINTAGLVRGAYHFFLANDDAASQAHLFLATVQFSPGDLPPVLDVEVTGGASDAQIWSGVATWLQLVEQATGRQPILYTAPGFWNSHEPDLSLTRYPLWLADYASQPVLPKGWTSWLFWQHSQSGSVSGVTGSVDLDVFSGTLQQLQELAGRA
ncbi:MAG TPA: glycoside hydrolase family 25 protein [Thermoanaerobaculia bacterium]|nr:glycoside hydrolase family 25 protein [Thermoanaerobaculia bacterium]